MTLSTDTLVHQQIISQLSNTTDKTIQGTKRRNAIHTIQQRSINHLRFVIILIIVVSYEYQQNNNNHQTFPTLKY